MSPNFAAQTFKNLKPLMNKTLSRWEGCCYILVEGEEIRKCPGTKGFVLERDSVIAILFFFSAIRPTSEKKVLLGQKYIKKVFCFKYMSFGV